MKPIESRTLDRVLDDVVHEIGESVEKHGDQWHLPDGTVGSQLSRVIAEMARLDCDRATAEGRVSWSHILTEEHYEALAETDPLKLKAELIQVAAVAVKWVMSIDLRMLGEVKP